MPHHYENEYASTDPQEVKTIVSRTESTQYLVLDSKNRNFSAQGGNSTTSQAWNNFRLQRPQSLMQSFATRVLVSEIRFPWYIPNITTLNNTLYIEGQDGSSADIIVTLALPPKFYTPADIVAALNTLITSSTLAANYIPTFSYDDNLKIYSVTYPTNTGPPLARSVVWYNPNVIAAPPQSVFESSASLAKTMGFDWKQISGFAVTNNQDNFTGNPTESIYTQYIDIVSGKLNYYTHQKDGSSDPLTSDSLICRLYLADEISLANGGGQDFSQPFIIHRQFKTPKAVMWNKNAVIDWLDISVYDEWNNLIPLPQISVSNGTNPPSLKDGSYPNFQITLLATEN